jgi:hypothetical protein
MYLLSVMYIVPSTDRGCPTCGRSETDIGTNGPGSRRERMSSEFCPPGTE